MNGEINPIRPGDLYVFRVFFYGAAADSLDNFIHRG